MKISVSLSRTEADFLDEYVAASGTASRSEAVRRAIGLLRASNLEAAYESAWLEWGGSEVEELWESVSGDGLEDDAAR